MTEQTQPTDAELIDVWAQFVGDPTPKLPLTDADKVAFARAVLAKWGTPAGAGEPIGYINRGMAPHTEGKVVFHERPTENLEGRWWTPDQPVFATPQPTQALAGAVPLTDEWIRSKCKEPWIFETAKQWVRMTEAAHGIKGADHG